MLGNFECFFVACFLFSSKLVFKKSFMNTVRVANRLNQVRTHILSGLILVQTVCKGYLRMTLGGKELNMALVMVTMINKKLALYLLVTIRDHRPTLGTKSTPDTLQSKTLIILSKSVRNRAFYWRQMTIKNTVSSDFLSAFLDC